MGLKIQLHFGDTVIPATLNDSTAAKEFLKRLPCTIHASRYDFDICGILEKPLPRIKEESTSYGQYVNLGAVNCPLSQMEELYGNYAHPAFEGRGEAFVPMG